MGQSTINEFGGESLCPGCGVCLPIEEGAIPRVDASKACGKLYDELRGRTLVLGDLAFVHQYAVDAYTAQHLVDGSSSIRGAFALAGLCLAVERKFSGRQVQRAHTLMAKRRRKWPLFSSPGVVNWMTVGEVAKVSDRELPDALERWCDSVWAAFGVEHERVYGMLLDSLGAG
jgi:hypothetical protein